MTFAIRGRHDDVALVVGVRTRQRVRPRESAPAPVSFANACGDGGMHLILGSLRPDNLEALREVAGYPAGFRLKYRATVPFEPSCYRVAGRNTCRRRRWMRLIRSSTGTHRQLADQ